VLGAPAEAVAQMRAKGQAERPDTGFAVHPDNVTAIRLVGAMATQWRTATLSTMQSSQVVKTGLDYGQLDRVATFEGLVMTLPNDFRRVRLVEVEMLIVWAEQRARAR